MFWSIRASAMRDTANPSSNRFVWAAERSMTTPAARPSWRRWGGRLPRPSRRGGLGLAIVVSVVVMAIAADVLAPRDRYELNLQAVLQPPSSIHPFGTDETGRD